MSEPKLSALELRIMSEFWTRGACSIREIHEAVVKRDKPAYTTVQTMVYRLEAKGAVRRTKKIGNAHVFEATTSRASVQTRLLKELLGLFGGNAGPVMAHLVEMGKISHEDIEDAQKLLDAHQAKSSTGTRANDPRADRPPVAVDAVLRRHLVDHAGLACQFRGRTPLVVAAGVDQVPRTVFGAVSRWRRGWARNPCRDPANFLRSGDAGRVADDFSLAHAERYAAAGAFAAAAGVAVPVGPGGLRARVALAARLARRGVTVQGSAAGAGRIAGCSRHGCGCRTLRRARDSSGGVAAVRAAREVVLLAARRRDGARTRAHRAPRQSQGAPASAGRDAVLVSPAGVVHRPAVAGRTRARLRRGGDRTRPRSGRICGRHPRGLQALRHRAFASTPWPRWPAI